ncbi:hypothetical protein [Clostridium sp.]|uniref:hypothetical protein n=1 Tax=Clostridium sp. TaxID=1506 RepID=UPI0028458A27|nr:hypothetical protein [Clostridium sp.]MDR3596578.1 hypothetical protein [Clostridium sp.]
MLTEDLQAFKAFKDERINSLKQIKMEMEKDYITKWNTILIKQQLADNAVEIERKRSREHWSYLDHQHLRYLQLIARYTTVEIQSFKSNMNSNIQVIKDLISNLNNLETDFETSETHASLTMGNTDL